MTPQDIINSLQEKITQLNQEADNHLKKLGERTTKEFPNMSGMYDVDFDYLNRIAKYAWGERGKKIALIQLQEQLNKLKNEL